jgi:hypothetical protein
LEEKDDNYYPLQLRAINDLLAGKWDGLIDLLADCKKGKSTPSDHVIFLLERLRDQDPSLNYWLLSNKTLRPPRGGGRPVIDVSKEDYILDWLCIFVDAKKYDIYKETNSFATDEHVLELLSQDWQLPSDRSARYKLLKRSRQQKKRMW